MPHSEQTSCRLRTVPAPLRCVLMDCRVAEEIRMVRGCLARTGRNLEIAFLLSGYPPTPDRPARIVDAQPIGSTSSSARVDTAPEAQVSAHRALLSRVPNARAGVIAIAHTHPSSCTLFSTIDHDWHSACLDNHFRRDLIFEVPMPDGGAPAAPGAPPDAARIQVFYSLVFGASGRFDEASAYLLTRPVGGDRRHDKEVEIGLFYTESRNAARSVEALRLRLDWLNRWEARISYEWDRPVPSGADSGVDAEDER